MDKKFPMTCIECGKDFHKREHSKIENPFCSFWCQKKHHDLERYKNERGNGMSCRHIPNGSIVAKTLHDYYGGYSE